MHGSCRDRPCSGQVTATPSCHNATLQALSQGAEWQLLEQQLLTVKGYKLLQCCHTALEQLQRVLSLQHPMLAPLPGTDSSSSASHTGSRPGLQLAVRGLEAAARQWIGLMCDGRLMPTPWLNEVRAAANTEGSCLTQCTPLSHPYTWVELPAGPRLLQSDCHPGPPTHHQSTPTNAHTIQCILTNVC